MATLRVWLRTLGWIVLIGVVLYAATTIGVLAADRVKDVTDLAGWLNFVIFCLGAGLALLILRRASRAWSSPVRMIGYGLLIIVVTFSGFFAMIMNACVLYDHCL